MTNSAAQGLSILRDSSNFQWYVIPILLMVIYIYSAEIGKKNFQVVFAGLALFGMDFFNEIWNALIFHFSQYAPVWGAPGKTAYLVLIGWNIEIIFMFLIMGLAAAKTLPNDKNMKILGIPNRLFIAVGYTALCVIVECILNAIGALTWEYPWWSIQFPLLVFLVGYFPFFFVSFKVFDMKTNQQRAKAVGAIYAFNFLFVIIFGGILGWL